MEANLREGDVAVMVSDGILSNDPDCEWLTTYLTEACQKTPEEIVSDICLHASESACRDDRSAVAIRIAPAVD